MLETRACCRRPQRLSVAAPHTWLAREKGPLPLILLMVQSLVRMLVQALGLGTVPVLGLQPVQPGASPSKNVLPRGLCLKAVRR